MLRVALAAAVLAACGPAPDPAPRGPAAGWPTWGGDPGGSRYSPLREIDRENAGTLEVAWTYHTGDASPGRGPDKRGKTTFEATPVLLGDALYFCSPMNRVFALDAETGAERWVFDPEIGETEIWARTCRGVAVWTDPEAAPGAVCRDRVFTATTDARLFALDAATGLPCPDFRGGAAVDLREGIGDIGPDEYGVTSPPTLIRDVVAVGSMVGDNRRVNGPGGVVRGFDARSGALRWAFDPVPPGTPAPPPGPEGAPRYHRGTPNAWGVFTADPGRDLLFLPMGSASPDYYGGQRGLGDHYADAVVALRGATGEVVWSFRTVHHDLWDYDLAAQPTLIELSREGVAVPAVVQATKMGHVFLLDRETGEPLYPVDERPAPQGDADGERYAATQPVPTFPPPLHPLRLSPEDAWGATPWDRNACRARLARLRNEGIYTPPSVEGSVQYPGVAGGTNWGGVAYDPERRLLVLPMNRVANVQTLVPRDRYAARRAEIVRGRAVMGISPQEGAPYAVEHEVLVTPFGVPCTRPPWGTLLAVDLGSGEVAWEVPLGSARDIAPVPFAFDIGLPSMGGPLVTASGVAFIAAAMDDYLRAFDVETGEELWRGRLPAGGQATPMTYRPRDGARQLVVIAAGGHGSAGTTLGDSLVAFALPE